MKILKFPIARITIWFILGILTAYYSKLNFGIAFICLSIALVFFGFIYFKINQKINQHYNFGLSLYFLFFSIGITTTVIHNETFRKNHYIHNQSFFDDNHTIQITIQEKLKSTKNNHRYLANIKLIDDKIIFGKILLNLKKDSISRGIETGMRLKISSQLIKNFKPNNPNQFDYGKYLESKGIYAQVFLDYSQIKISTKTDKTIGYYTAKFRNRIIKNLEKSNFKKEELAVITALILGQQQDISQEVLQDYQYAGAVHILSVSGLHVGFILIFLTFILQPLPKNKYGNTIRAIIILSSLWLFALVAGMAPSVVRSATMFSFVAIGLFLNRETNMYHNILVSLFLILLIEPLFLLDIGFQLSYIALFFILWLQPLLKSLWKPKNKIITYFWDILTVSFAAQIGAMPLSIYYFHQFPGLFFVTNLVLIPILSIIMALGVLLMLLAYFNVAPTFLIKIVEISIGLMNFFIKKIASIETFVIKDIPLSFWLLVVAYCIVFSWIIWFKKPSYTKLIIAIASILCFQFIFITNHWLEESKKELIVFNAKRNSIIAERVGENINLLTNNKLVENSFEKKMVQSYAIANFCEINSIKELPNSLVFNNQKILVIDNSSILKLNLKPDIIILKDSPKLNLERLLLHHKPKLVIADASNYKTYIYVWKQTCLKSKIPFHSIYEKGYYCLK
jgi:competence protein ComEC